MRAACIALTIRDSFMLVMC